MVRVETRRLDELNYPDGETITLLQDEEAKAG